MVVGAEKHELKTNKLLARKLPNSTAQLQRKQGRRHLRGGQSRPLDHRIDGPRLVRKRFVHQRIFFSQRRLCFHRYYVEMQRGPLPGIDLWKNLIENILGAFNQFRSLFDRRFDPRQACSLTEPGTANTSRPCSNASFAVIKEPLSVAASPTNTPNDSPLMIRFLRGK